MAFWIPIIMAASTLAPIIYDWITSNEAGGDDTTLEPKPPEDLGLTDVEIPQAQKALRDDKVVTELREYYNIPQQYIDQFRSEITKLTSERDEHQRVSNKAYEYKYNTLGHVNDQVVGPQRQKVIVAAGSYARDYDKALKNVNALSNQIAVKTDQLNSLYDMQSRQPSDANDLAALQISQTTGVPIERVEEKPTMVEVGIAKNITSPTEVMENGKTAKKQKKS